MSRSANTNVGNGYRLTFILGILFLGVGCAILGKLFYAPAKAELVYAVHPPAASVLTPPNTDFAIVIPAIGAAAPIVTNVNPYNVPEYEQALSHGVAHSVGSGLPGQGKNIFLFAHSSVDLLVATRFNSVFYLIHHLRSGDDIQIWYHGTEHTYVVVGQKIVAPTDVSIMAAGGTEKLTLMTCWPPGTSLERLIVTALPKK